MLRDITIGQYYRTESDIHKLDPRTKIICTLIMVITLFIFKGFVQYVVAAAFVGMVIHISNVPFKHIIRGLKPVLILIIFTAVCQLVFTKTGTVLVDLGFMRLYSIAVKNAILFTVRIVFLIIGTSMMTYTTTPNQLTDGLEVVLKPLKLLKVPVHDMASYVDRMIVMNKGQIAYDDSPTTIFEKADELEKIGLDVPQCASLINRLRKEGYLVPNSNYTVESTCNILLQYICNILGKSTDKRL